MDTAAQLLLDIEIWAGRIHGRHDLEEVRPEIYEAWLAIRDAVKNLESKG